MGLAVAIARARRRGHRDLRCGATPTSRSSYLPPFVGEDVAGGRAGDASSRARCSTRSSWRPPPRRDGDGCVLDGVKSLVPRAARGRAVRRRRRARGRRPGAVHRRGAAPTGLLTEPEPAMGVRAAATGELIARGRRASRATALLGDGDPDVYARVRARARGWPGARWRSAPARRARLRHPVRERAQGVRRADQPPPGGRVHGRRHRDRARGHAPGDLRAASRADAGKPFAREAAVARHAVRRAGACRSAPTASSCSAATATSRSTRSSAGTATCAPPA